jgi:hypothetical protein
MVNAVSRVWRFVRGAPLTYLWPTVLLATTVIEHSVNRRHLVLIAVFGWLLITAANFTAIGHFPRSSSA